MIGDGTIEKVLRGVVCETKTVVNAEMNENAEGWNAFLFGFFSITKIFLRRQHEEMHSKSCRPYC